VIARTLAHVSDLHLGRDARTDEAAAALVRALLHEGVDDVLVTGDVTHRGRDRELATFERLFAPLADRLLVVPGNHDRAGHDVAARLMPGARVVVERRPGLRAVRVDSTGPHNRRAMDSHGTLLPEDVGAVLRALDAAPRGVLVVLMLHHHLHRLPADHLGERLATLLGLPNAAELERGPELLEKLGGRCDLVLHGHRHRASERVLHPRGGRPLHVLNAGSTPELGRARVLAHAAGQLVSERWVEVAAPRPADAPAVGRVARSAA
jgi:3',5'-cyclic-AMP phosphodiesterase